MHNVFSIHTNICFVCETVEKKNTEKIEKTVSM